MRILGRFLRAVALLLVLALAVWGFAIEPNRLVVREARIALPQWPAELSGLRIAVLADFHTGAPFIDDAKLARIVATVARLRPDVIVLLGDYVCGMKLGRFVPPEQTARALAGLQAPLGVYAVLGNHDWWFDGPRVRRAFEEVGVPVLENDAVRLTRDGRPFWLIGLADLWTRRPDFDGPLARVPEGEPVVVLTHSPDVFPDVPARVALTLAGHTHGGQVVLPLVGRMIVPSRYGQRYAVGHVAEDGRHLFVTPGIGTSIIPVRFGVPPEISLVTLDASAGDAHPALEPRLHGAVDARREPR